MKKNLLCISTKAFELQFAPVRHLLFFLSTFINWKCRSHRPEVFCKKFFLKILENSYENTCIRVSFLNKVTDLRFANLLKRRIWLRRFLLKFYKVFTPHFWKNTSVGYFQKWNMMVLILIKSHEPVKFFDNKKRLVVMY